MIKAQTGDQLQRLGWMAQGLTVRLEELLLLGGTCEEPAQTDCIRNQPSSEVFLVVLLAFIPVQHLCLC